jgi:hypothetical protein
MDGLILLDIKTVLTGHNQKDSLAGRLERIFAPFQ